VAISAHAITVTLDGLNDPGLPPITGAAGIGPEQFGIIPTIPDNGTPAGKETSVDFRYAPPPPEPFSDLSTGWHADWTIIKATGREDAHRHFQADTVDIFQFPPSGTTFQPLHYITIEAGDTRFDLGNALNDYFDLVNTRGARLIGNDLANFLKGGARADEIYGGAGDDTITPGNSADDLWGGNGSDHFVFKSIGDSDLARAGRDVVHDFQGHDHTARFLALGIADTIDLCKIDADTTQAGNQAFTFFDGHHFTGHAGELMIQGDVVKGDTDGDAHSNFAITVHGLAGTADDFIL
jgi:Ca2+-binding RTX toxin-like protein